MGKKKKKDKKTEKSAVKKPVMEGEEKDVRGKEKENVFKETEDVSKSEDTVKEERKGSVHVVVKEWDEDLTPDESGPEERSDAVHSIEMFLLYRGLPECQEKKIFYG